MSRYQEVPSKVDFPSLEHRILDFWKEQRCFETLRERNRGKPRWSFLDGPITANNPMGVHHAWGRFYKDAFCRFNAMLGRELRYQNGFDCQGLWVEVEVEKELGFKTKRDIEEFGIAAFVAKCKDRVRHFAGVQTQQSIRLGYWMDWDDSYYTMSDENNYTIWAFLKKCHQNGWIYKGTDVMPWCGRCGTGLSQHEIATEGYRELTHVSPYLRLPISDRKDEYLLVWTTTPWTLTSNVACAVHPEHTYLKVRQGDAVYYLIQSRESILKEKGPYQVLEKIPGSQLVGWTYTGPFDELEVQAGTVHRVIPWTEVTEKEGTGIVHIAPGCGKEDFELSKIHGLSVIAPLDELGMFGPRYGSLAGKEAGAVAQEVLDLLKAKGLLYKRENYSHSYPVCWRCSRELVFRLVDEWYIRMGEQLDKPLDQITPEEKRQNLRYQIIDVIKEARWIPSYGHDRELDWLRNMHDWMISKKRYWGLALPIFLCEACGTFDVIGGREELKARAVAGWDQVEGQSPHRPWVDAIRIACPGCGESAARIKDVGNPWLDAGIVPLSTMGWSSDREYWTRWFPADLITESFPGQFRNWFYSILAMSTVMAGRAPFKTLFGYASMKAQDGREMHKSWGNSIDFNEAAEKAGVDPMRWLFATHIPEQNLCFGYAAIDEARRRFLTLWNVYSFFVTYARVDGFDPGRPRIPVAQRSVLDRWILGSLQKLIDEARRGYGEYQLHVFMRHLERFIDGLSTWYVRRSRRRFWKSEDDQDKLAAYQTLHEVLVTVVEILAPVTPFVTEEMYQNLVRSWDDQAPVSVHHRTFPTADASLVDEALNQTMDQVLVIVELARQARQKAALKVRQPLAKMLVKLPSTITPDSIRPFEAQIKEELNIKELDYRKDLADLIFVSVKLEAQKAGPRLGKVMQKALAAFKTLSGDEVVARIARGPLHLEVGGAPLAILPEEVTVERKGAPGYALAESGELVVLISTEVTEALKQEGLVRDLIRHVQELRKESRLDVADRIELTLEAGQATTGAVRANLEMLRKETLATQVSFRPPDLPHRTEVKLDDETVAVSLKRV
ncbi:MAG: isoleucine--tRNA ligase [Candidatus Riflebacteria bacterium]|nr:isoleucine--tRNA ligase [Candidatus Riflebacteria bacterium]